jgi:hypothetical protein
MDVGLLLSDAARNRLKRLFQQLDTDKDGYDSTHILQILIYSLDI